MNNRAWLNYKKIKDRIECMNRQSVDAMHQCVGRISGHNA